ncbi:neuropeptide CCHamide-1 receptor-like [Tubulanus polymorphus]|uniref:neuropeptide CCHamide-1 receptor-like n=1 Tax=Tubulanus polymorphus TaxID=672921 RepID=UPI003DA54047
MLADNTTGILESNTTNSSSNSSVDIFELNETPEAIIAPIVFLIIFVIGVAGNGTLIFTVVRNKSMRNVPNIFILSLAAGDLTLILVSVPCTSTIYTFTNWPYGVVMCKINVFLQTMSLGVSVFTLVALAGDRFTAIVNPMRKHMGNPVARTVVMATSIWVVSFLLAIPDAVSAHIFPARDKYGVIRLYLCNDFRQEWGSLYPKAHSIFRLLVYFIIPILVISGFYAAIANILMRSSYQIPGEVSSQANHGKQIEARKKVAKVVLSLVVIFVICWLPRHIFVMWFHFDPGDYSDFWHAFKVFGFVMSYINSCVNPITLYFLSKQFRKYYNRYLFCCCAKRRSPVEGSTSMYNFNSTVRRTSTTMTMLPHSQSV